MDSVQLFEKQLYDKMARIEKGIDNHSALNKCGKVVKSTGMAFEVAGMSLPLGSDCKIYIGTDQFVDAEVIGFNDNSIIVMPYEYCYGIANGMPVIAGENVSTVPVGEDLLGRVVDSLGRPLDGKGEISTTEFYPLYPAPLNPLNRARITQVLDVGVRAINGLITTCKGQRIGIFAESGIGKSVLLGMMTRFTEADVVVVGLIGERGREVKEFIEEIIGVEGLKKTVVVVAPSDSTPLMKVSGAAYANSIAEYFRDKNKDVLLIIDSLTRFAHSWREITLSSGELPTARGFTPSVFARLSQLVERSGNGTQDQGSITSYYTVLIEGEELSDPVAEQVRSLIDGHIVLSRELAESGHFPAINIEKSVSRLMNNIVDQDHASNALSLKRVASAYNKNKDMINIGMYQVGSDRLADLGMKFKSEIEKFLIQNMNEKAGMEVTLSTLSRLVADMRGVK